MPTATDISNDALGSFGRMFFEDLAICCVNVFVLISGWFGIKASVKGFCNFIFQALFICTTAYLVAVVCGVATLNVRGILNCVLLREYWFVLAYIALYILSPILNVYIQNVTTKQLGYTVLLFYIFQTVYGWTEYAGFVTQGFSVFSFFGLYLLAQWLKQMQSKLYKFGLVLYLVSALLNVAAFYIAVVYMPDSRAWIMAVSYVNPFCILSAVGLLCYFATISGNWKNKAVNYIAGSAFAVYLLHANFALMPIFLEKAREIYQNNDGIQYFALIFLFLVAVFAISVLWDQPRRWLWIMIAKKINK